MNNEFDDIRSCIRVSYSINVLSKSIHAYHSQTSLDMVDLKARDTSAPALKVSRYHDIRLLNPPTSYIFEHNDKRASKKI